MKPTARTATLRDDYDPHNPDTWTVVRRGWRSRLRDLIHWRARYAWRRQHGFWP